MMGALSNFVGSLSEDYTGYIVIIICVVLGYSFMNSNKTSPSHDHVVVGDDEEEDQDPPRNFTSKQLRYFDGARVTEGRIETEKPLYLSLNGKVFDVSKGREFYGPGGPYEAFAGRECGVALAKMSFDEEHLDTKCDNLNFGEKAALDEWMEKFQYYKSYPVVGRLLLDSELPDGKRIISKAELAKHKGNEDVPEGYAVPPIYIGALGKVFDVSFGGVTFYGDGCPYNAFAGEDASRALAKMSLDPKDAQNPDISDLSEKETKTLKEWVSTFEDRKNYPLVGILE